MLQRRGVVVTMRYIGLSSKLITLSELQVHYSHGDSVESPGSHKKDPGPYL